jgi:hypothetical protein
MPTDALQADVWNPHWETDDRAKPWLPLPLEVEDITPEWLTAALYERAPGIRVTSREILKVKHGFTSVVTVRIEMNEAGRRAGVTPQLFIKGGFTSYSRNYVFSYAMEAHGYRDVWPHLGLNMPKVFFAGMDVERRQSIIIMEDLTLRGVKFGHGLQPQGYDMLARRLGALAAMHAKTYDSPELEPGGRWDGVLNNRARMLRIHCEQNGFLIPEPEGGGRQGSRFRQRPPFLSPEGWETLWEERMTQNAAASHHFRDREWNHRAMLHVEALTDRLPKVISHADTHLGNHYEEPDGTPGFFDSMPQKEPVYFDLAYTIGCGLDPYDRKRWERSLVGHYVDEIGRHGVRLDYDQTYYYYSLFLHQGYIVFIINDPVWQTPAFNTVNVWRFCQAMIDNNTKELFDAAFAAADKPPVRP